MKTLTTRIMMTFAAGMVAAGTMAYGQTAVKAEIPFAFRTANASMPAGTYTFYRMPTSGNTETIELQGKTSRVFLVSAPLDIYSRPQDKPSIVFACDSDGCRLREIKVAYGSYHYPSGPAKGARGKQEITLISIPLTTRNGD